MKDHYIFKVGNVDNILYFNDGELHFQKITVTSKKSKVLSVISLGFTYSTFIEQREKIGFTYPKKCQLCGEDFTEELGLVFFEKIKNLLICKSCTTIVRVLHEEGS